MTRPQRLPAMAACAAVAAFAALWALSLAAQPDEDVLGERTGGNTTVWATGQQAFSFSAANLNDDERTAFHRQQLLQAQLGGSAGQHQSA